MNKLGVVDAPLSPFDEARAQIAKWEKEFPDTGHIGLVLDAPEVIEVTVAGCARKPTYSAGMFFDAARIVLE